VRRVWTFICVALIVLTLSGRLWTRERSRGIALVLSSGAVEFIGIHRGHFVLLLGDMTIKQPGRRGGLHAVSLASYLADDVIDSLRPGRTFGRHAAGFEWIAGGQSPRNYFRSGRCVGMVLPPWLLCSIGAVGLMAPCLRRSRGAGVCSHCGYDVRATPLRCPECGSELAAIAPPAMETRT